MNQILYTEDTKKNQNKIKSIIIFFSVFLIIFGASLAGIGGYNIVSSNNKRKEEVEMAIVPEITLENENNKVIIKVEHIRNIKLITYSWNGEDVVNLNENETNKVTESIDIPAGTNNLYVKVVDVNGKYASKEKEFSYDGTYMDLSVVDNSKLRIVVTDTKGLQSVTYNWNTEEGITEYAENTETETIEIETAIPTGMNTITVTAVNNENKKVTKEQQVQGITKPTISITYNSDRTLFTIKMKDDQGIESYSYALYNAKVEDIAENGQLISNYKDKLTEVKSSNGIQGNGKLEITDKLELVEGFNYLIVKAKNIEGAEAVFSGWCVK